MDSFYIGSDLKFLIEITAEGFDQDADDYTIVLKCGSKTETYNEGNIVTSASGKHYLFVDTSDYQAGVLTATITATYTDPDSDPSVGLSNMVEVVELCYLKEVP